MSALAHPRLTFAAFFAAVAWYGFASAQTETPRCAELRGMMHALSYSHYWKAPDRPALELLLSQIPPDCTAARALLTQALASIDEHAQWRVLGSDGVIAITTPPVEPEWIRDREVWPDRLDNSMMTASPTQADIWRLHPPRALDRKVIGAVSLEGRVASDGSLVWRILDAGPANWGFEDAAIRAAALYRAPATFEDGRSTFGASFFTVIAFTRPSPRPVFYD